MLHAPHTFRLYLLICNKKKGSIGTLGIYNTHSSSIYPYPANLSALTLQKGKMFERYIRIFYTIFSVCPYDLRLYNALNILALVAFIVDRQLIEQTTHNKHYYPTLFTSYGRYNKYLTRLKCKIGSSFLRSVFVNLPTAMWASLYDLIF